METIQIDCVRNGKNQLDTLIDLFNQLEIPANFVKNGSGNNCQISGEIDLSAVYPPNPTINLYDSGAELADGMFHRFISYSYLFFPLLLKIFWGILIALILYYVYNAIPER